MGDRSLPRRHDRAMRPLVRIGGALLVGGAVVAIALILSGALARRPVDGTVAVTLLAALAVSSFGAGSLIVVLLTPR